MKTNYISNELLKRCLDTAIMDEKKILTKILNLKGRNYTNESLVVEISKLGSNNPVYDLFRGEGTSYIDILIDMCEKLKIDDVPSYYFEVNSFDKKDSLTISEEEAFKKNNDLISQLENKILTNLLQNYYNNLEESKKLAFDERLATIFSDNKQSLKILSGSAGILALGNLGGFATYTFLTSALSTLSFGTLGFGAYLSATYITSLLLGPIGWTALAGMAIFNMLGPSDSDNEKLLKSIIQIITIKQRLYFDQILISIENEINSIELTSFDKIYRYCKNLSPDKTDPNIMYFIDYGKMHKAFMYHFFEKHIKTFDNTKALTIIDWGCDQGLSTLALLDYIREKQIDLQIDSIYLIDADTTKLKLAKIYISSLVNKNVSLYLITKSIDKVLDSDLKLQHENNLNIFTNYQNLKHINIDTFPLPSNGGFYLSIDKENCEVVENFFNEYHLIFGTDLQLLSLEASSIGKYKFNEIFFRLHSKG